MHPLAKKYESNRALYVELTKFAHDHMNKCLSKNNLKFLKTDFRTKDVNSLDKKLSNGKMKVSKVEDINDLAAARTITLLEKQSSLIVRSLQEYFGWRNCVFTPKYSSDGYNADHLIVTVTAGMARKKSEKNLIGLKFEIQVVSILYSVWAQLGHDLVYKDDLNLKEFNPEFHLSLETKFKDLMKNHLKPLTDELDVIDSMVLSQARGQKIQDSVPLKNLSSQNDAKVLASGIHELKDTLSAVGNRTSSKYSLADFTEDIVSKILNNQIKANNEHSIETNSNDVASALVGLFLYSDPKILPKSVQQLLSLENYVQAVWTKKSIKDLLAQLTRLNPNVYRVHGFQLYDDILTVILGEIKKNGFSDSTISIWKCIAHLQFESSSFDGYAFHITHGVPEVTEQLTNLRKRFIADIFVLYPTLKLRDKIKTINLLGEFYQNGFRVPQNSASIIEIENTMNAIVAELEKLVNAGVGVVELERIERHLDLVQKRFSKKLCKAARAVKRKIKADKSYKVFREVAAYETEFIIGSLEPEMKLGYDKFFKKKVKKEKQLHKLLTQIQIFLISMQDAPDEERSRMAICLCLDYIAKTNQSWVKSFLDKSQTSKIFGVFEYPLLLGLASGGELKFYADFCLKNVSSYLIETCTLLHYEKSYTTELWQACFNQVKVNKNKAAINLLIYSILSYETDESLRLSSLRKILNFAISEKNEFHAVSVYHSFESNFKKLSPNDLKLFLKLLLNKKTLDFNTDTMVGWIADLSPELIIWYFEERIKVESKWQEKEGLFKTYKAIPHDLYWLEQSSIGTSIESLKKTLAWVPKGGEFLYCATNLINMLWASEKDEISKFAVDRVTKYPQPKKVRDIFNFVKNIDNSALHVEFAEAFILSLKNWRDFEGDLEILVGYHGVVNGQDGFLNVYSSNIEFANERKSKTKGDVKSFWRKIAGNNAKSKSVEHRRIDWEKAQKRLVYGK